MILNLRPLLRRALGELFRKPSRRALAVLALLPIAAAVGWGATQVGAQQNGLGSGALTPGEQEAYDLYLDEQLISARTKAEEVLEANTNSIMGHFVMGAVLHEAEGSLARAMYHFGRAREIYETTWNASTRPAGAPWELHREILYKIQGLAGEMELYDYQLQVLGYHDYLYDPDLLAEHTWPLLHLERYDEAREFAERATKVRSDEFQRSAGYNALCAIEGEAGTRQPYLDACVAALENARRRAGTEDEGALAVHAYNAAMAARATLAFDQAESLALEGARRLEMTPANPWRELARLYIDQGRMTDAVEALREMQRWKRRQPAYLRDHARAETDVVFASVLLVAGETEVALGAVDRAIQQPDRRGLTTSTPEQALGAHALIRRAIVHTQAERDRELAAADGFFGGMNLRLAAHGATTGAFADEERIRTAVTDDDRLVRTFRVYVKGGIEPIPVWLLGDLVEVLGAGVSAVAIREARREEGDDTRMTPYYQALEAEVALARGDERRAQTLAEAALQTLPSTEQLLRARVMAIAAEAARDRGQNSQALGFYAQVLQTDGGVLRRLGLAIPARVQVAASGDIAERAGDMFERSPRFDDDPGFTVRLSSGGGRVVSACLLDVNGARVGCAEVDPDALQAQYEEALAAYQVEVDKRRQEGQEIDDLEPPEPPDAARTLYADFHDRIFSAPIVLSSADLSSLDGRTTTGGEAAREQMRNLLDQAMNPPP